jgi:hypothetical protein
MMAADRALYQAKRLGRHRTEPAEPAGELTSTATSQARFLTARAQRNSRAESPFPAPGVLFDQIAAFLVSEYSAFAVFH